MTAPAAQPTTEFSVFLPFGKVDQQPDGTILVHSRVNDETLDDQGEIVTYEAVEKASGPYLEWANVREQHQADTAAGTMVSLTPIPAERAHEAILHIVDPTAVQKVLTKVYKGTSLGGFKRRIALAKVGGETQRRVTEIDWRETSLVDRPSRPSAVLTLLKRSEAADPPELIEEETAVDPETPETPVVETAAPATPEAPATTTAAPATAAGTAPEAGLDAYTGPDGQPVEKAAAAAPIAAVASPVADVSRETLAKSATDDVRDAAWILSDINRLIETEAGEGDTEGVAQLKTAQAALVAFVATESAEVGTPEDQAEVVAEEAAEEAARPIPVIVVDALMAYASKGGDLAKIGGLLEEALAKASTPQQPATDVDELLRKTTDLIDERFARYVSRTDLDAMKGEVLGALKPLEETLTKIARMPVPGGPARYAIDTSRLEGGSPDPTTEIEVLHKAAASATDPYVKEALGKLAAAAEISSARS